MKMKFVKPVLLLTVIAGLTIGNRASADDTVAKYSQLDALRSQNALLTEALKNAELKSKLLASAKPTTTATTAAPVASKAATVAADPNGGFAAPSSAQVQMVSGTGNNLVALIAMGNGSRVNARVGTAIPGLGVVQAISLNEVLVASKKQTISVPFASETTSAPAQAGAASPVSFPASPAIMQMPPLPPSMQSRGGR